MIKFSAIPGSECTSLSDYGVVPMRLGPGYNQSTDARARHAHFALSTILVRTRELGAVFFSLLSSGKECANGTPFRPNGFLLSDFVNLVVTCGFDRATDPMPSVPTYSVPARPWLLGRSVTRCCISMLTRAPQDKKDVVMLPPSWAHAGPRN